MKTNLLKPFALTILLGSSPLHAAVCNITGNITNVITSAGDTAIKINAGATCNCAHSDSNATLAWIDSTAAESRTMISAALAAKATNANVTVSLEDGRGQGTAGNDSITHRYWLDCMVQALELN